MKIHLDLPKCMATGNCVLVAPTVFGQDENGFAQLLQEHPSATEHAAIREAVSACPAAVISISDE